MVQFASDPVPHTRQLKLIILDRDGVINYDSDQYIKSPDEWRPIPGSLEAIARLNHAGFRVVVATNQSGLGRGLFDTTTLISIHEKLHKALAQVGGRIDAVFFCPHAADSDCECRKPKPGMLADIGTSDQSPARSAVTAKAKSGKITVFLGKLPSRSVFSPLPVNTRIGCAPMASAACRSRSESPMHGTPVSSTPNR